MLRGSVFSNALGLSFALALTGCAASGAKSFQRGEKASQDGDLDAAASAYKVALEAEPQNAGYKAALARTQKELASQQEAVARQKEKSGDWKGASDAWSRASELVPGDQDFKARKELSGLKALDLGPDEWFEAVKKVSDTIPGSSIVEKSLAGARAKACQHHVALGDQFLSSNEGTKAISHYDRAKEIEPSSPGLDPARYDEASALMLMEQGDAKLAAGAPLEAHDLYQRAFEKRPLPELKSKIAKVKAKSQGVLAKLEAARALAERGKSLEALKIYESLQGAAVLPPSLDAEIARVKGEAARDETEKARSLATSGDFAKAQRSLVEAIRNSSLERGVLEGMSKAAQEIQEGRPGTGYRTLEGIRAQVNDGLFAATKAIAIASAKKVLEKAQSLSKRDAAGALSAISDLGPFEDEIPAIRELRRSLRAGTFQETLDAALRVAKGGDDAEAAELMVIALGASSAPQAIRDIATEASGALKAGKYAEAEIGFQKGLAIEPRSKLASRGLEIARLRRREAEKQALQVLKSATGDDARAVTVLASGLKAEPDDAAARQGADLLLTRAESSAARSTDEELATLLALASRLVDAPSSSVKALDEGRASLERGDHAGAERAFSKALDSAPKLRVAKVGRDLSKQRLLAPPTSDARGPAAAGGAGDQDQEREALRKATQAGRDSPEAKAAIEAAIREAERRLAQGDEKGSVRVLRAVVEVAGEVKDLSGALIRFESGKYEDADAELARSSSELARRIAALFRQRKLGTLKAGLSGEDRAAGESIHALLQADPNDKEALAAFARLLEKARTAASKGDDRASSEALLAACIAQGAPEELSNLLRGGSSKLGEKMYAEAERQYLDALRISTDSKVGKVGAEIAKQSRLRAEKAALEALSAPNDPSPHARTLLASMQVDPSSKVVASALTLLLARAEKASKKADDADAARTLDAAALLETLAPEVMEGLSKANALLAQSSFEEAEAGYSGVLAGEGGASRRSRVAESGRSIAHARRIGVLRSELEAAKREGDVLKQSRAVQKILELDRSDPGALAISKKLRAAVIESRFRSARSQKELGKPGVAYLYLKRVLELDPANAKAESDLQGLAASLKTRLDLVVVVDGVARAAGLPEHACKSIEEALRTALMSEGSKRDDLGAYILSPDWTKTFERGDKEAPEVSGKLKTTLSKCEHGAGVGRLTLLWQLAAPPDAEPVVKGVVEADLPAGLIPRDEQDGEGKNAKRALAQRASKALLQKLSEERGAVDLWLLAVAEHGIKAKDAALVADAYARLSIKKPTSIDPVRVSLVEQYLDAEFK